MDTPALIKNQKIRDNQASRIGQGAGMGAGQRGGVLERRKHVHKSHRIHPHQAHTLACNSPPTLHFAIANSSSPTLFYHGGKGARRMDRVSLLAAAELEFADRPIGCVGSPDQDPG